MIWRVQCSLMDVCRPGGFAERPIREDELHLVVPVSRRNTMPEVVSGLRNQLWGGTLSERLPEGLSLISLDMEIRRAVRTSRDAWADSDPSEAHFLLWWEPALSFVKIHQNQVYDVRVGAELVGRLCQPKQRQGWFYVRQGVAKPLGPWRNLNTARDAVARLVESSSKTVTAG